MDMLESAQENKWTRHVFPILLATAQNVLSRIVIEMMNEWLLVLSITTITVAMRY